MPRIRALMSMKMKHANWRKYKESIILWYIFCSTNRLHPLSANLKSACKSTKIISEKGKIFSKHLRKHANNWLNFRMWFKYGLKAQKSVWSLLAKVQWAYKLQKKKESMKKYDKTWASMSNCELTPHRFRIFALWFRDNISYHQEAMRSAPYTQTQFINLKMKTLWFCTH